MGSRTEPVLRTAVSRGQPPLAGAGADRSVWRRVVAGVAVGAVLLVVVPPVLQLVDPGTSRQLQGTTVDSLEPTDVSFTNNVDQLSLAGQLFLPDTPGPHPAVALINGSGASSRSNSWYLTISEHLVKAGYAVLWPDKRGSGASEGDWQVASFEALARDAMASVDHLASRPDIDAARVGVVGMSQGGRIASIVAAEHDDLAFAVSFSGGVVPAHAALRYEEIHNLRQMGFLPGVSELLAHASSWVLINIRQPGFWDAVGDFDALPYWAEVDIPVLFQLGTADTNVDTTASVRRLEMLEQPNLHVRTYPGSGHAIEQPPEHGDALIRPEALADLTDFVGQATEPR